MRFTGAAAAVAAVATGAFAALIVAVSVAGMHSRCSTEQQ
jgi:hypothetical protein